MFCSEPDRVSILNEEKYSFNLNDSIYLFCSTYTRCIDKLSQFSHQNQNFDRSLPLQDLYRLAVLMPRKMFKTSELIWNMCPALRVVSSIQWKRLEWAYLLLDYMSKAESSNSILCFLSYYVQESTTMISIKFLANPVQKGVHHRFHLHSLKCHVSFD